MYSLSNRTRARLLVGALAALGGLTLVVGSRTASAHPHGGPPPEAYTACEGKAKGDTCSVQFRDMTLAGTCSTFGSDSKLSCKPDKPPPPPPEAYTACDGKAKGDACSVQFHGNAVAGTCDTHHDDTRLSCRPSDMPPPPPENP